MRIVPNLNEITTCPKCGSSDLLLYIHNDPSISDYKKCTEELRQAIKSGAISEDTLDYMVFKVLAWKYYKGIL